jgi:GT2 family glycosyltransferase
MISIISAVHNGLPMNRIFLHYLQKYTVNPYELIIIDNNSTDGSREFFEKAGARVIANSVNYSYPYCQNQGIAIAKHDILVFINNDIIVSPAWDQRMIDTAREGGFDILTPVGIEMVENAVAARALRRRWLRVKNPLSLLGFSGWNLRLMHRLMYGNWESFANRRFAEFGLTTREGFVGNTVMMTRRALEKVGLWDERIQGADFDLYIRSKKRQLEMNDIKPMHMALGVFIHHYIRLTVKSGYAPFADAANLITNEQKWGEEAMRSYCRDINALN